MQEISTINEVIAIEPRVGEILRSARDVKKACWEDYRQYKSQLTTFVGSYAQKEQLRSCSAYDVTLHTLCDALKI